MKCFLETERLYLRPFELSDAKAMFEGWTSDPEVSRYLTWTTHEDIGMTKALLEKWIADYEKPERLNFAIVLKEEGRLIGGIDVVGYLGGVKGIPVIGYNLARAYWNKGYMSEACRCLLDYLFSKGYAKVRIDAFTENKASRRVIEKCGGVYEGCEEEYLPLKDKTVMINRYVVYNPQKKEKRMLKLHKLSERIYYTDYEEERDRPILGYIKGERFSIAVDAGHSDEHLNEFYAALEAEGLPLPKLTIITHWHWDHSFAMHALHGLSIANKRTNAYLEDFISKQNEEYEKEFLKLDPSIAKEYADNKKIIVVKADLVYEKELLIDAGDVRVKVFEAISPHTDDASLIYVPEEKVLFLGDGSSGVFPTWIGDPDKKEALAKTIESLDVDYCIGGHWEIMNKEEQLKDLRSKEEL